jgi:hypothetical protein
VVEAADTEAGAVVTEVVATEVAVEVRKLNIREMRCIIRKKN